MDNNFNYDIFLMNCIKNEFRIIVFLCVIKSKSHEK
jgi:hypothetical protein